MNTWTLAINTGYDSAKVEIWGRNPDLDAGSLPETLWGPGGLFTWQTATESLELVSSSVNDASAGTGARTVKVSGLNSSWVKVEETVTLNGTTPVALANQYLRVNGTYVATAGSAGANVGTITLRTPAGVARGSINTINGVGMGVSQSGRYTVPTGSILICNYCQIGINSNSSNDNVTMGIFRRYGDVVGATWSAIEVFETSAIGTSLFNLDMRSRFMKFTEKQDVELKALDCIGTNIGAQIRLSGLLLVVNP